MLDEIDKVILHELGKNARISAYHIAYILHEMEYKITDRAIRQIETIREEKCDIRILCNS